MTLQERINILVKYCGQHHDHGFMMDERNFDEDFNIELPEETEIRKKINQLKVIILTGEAGDGKSRILRNIEGLLKEYGFENPCTDFSALTEREKDELINVLDTILKGKTERKMVIAANVGIFTQTAIRYDMKLMEELTRERDDIYILNFENRNLAEREDVFQEILQHFLKYDGADCPETNCPYYQNCAYQKNIEKLTSASGQGAMRAICNAIYLIGGHMTFRELLSFVAYTVTFGQNCKERQESGLTIDEQDKVLYYNIFEPSNDILMRKIACMDPALRRAVGGVSGAASKDVYISDRRQSFFEVSDQKVYYEMLNEDYLAEFYEVLEYINTPPYHFDTIQDKNAILQKIKKGINKMSNGGKGDDGLVVTDTPIIFDNQIRTEFMVMQDMTMIWHRYDIKLGTPVQNEKRLWNKFYLSYLLRGNASERRLISLLIDYKQFRYLMMCSEDFFMNRNELTVEEYAVNTFYRKILQEKEEAYESIVIRFEERDPMLCDFSLTIHSKEDIVTGKCEVAVRIRKED